MPKLCLSFRTSLFLSQSYADALYAIVHSPHCGGPGLQVDGVIVEVALQWCSDTFSDLLVGFVNSVKTVDGGTHIEGFKVGPAHA